MIHGLGLKHLTSDQRNNNAQGIVVQLLHPIIRLSLSQYLVSQLTHFYLLLIFQLEDESNLTLFLVYFKSKALHSNLNHKRDDPNEKPVLSFRNCDILHQT